MMDGMTLSKEINYQTGKTCLLFDKLEDEDSAKYLNSMPAYQVPENPQLNRASNVPHPATQPVVDVNLQFNAFDERNASDAPVKVPKKRGRKKINPDPVDQLPSTARPQVDGDEDGDMRFRFYESASARKRAVIAEERERAINAICQPEPAEAEPQHSVDLDMEDHTDFDFDFDDPQRFKKTDRKGKRAVAGENGGLLLELPSLMQG